MLKEEDKALERYDEVGDRSLRWMTVREGGWMRMAVVVSMALQTRHHTGKCLVEVHNKTL